MSHERTPSAPLSSAVLAILLALMEEDKHGYAIMQFAAAPAGGSLRMGPGTLYGTIDRMLRDGLIRESGLSDDERRRYYRITGQGQAVLSAELERLNQTLAAARRAGLVPVAGRR
ncbi:MAG: helix-turn-helix transcriptional regulator [Acidobacteriota bacterium]|nr:helix-turn-helix transcriptional regulator [Acidobacteriota bacterium]